MARNKKSSDFGPEGEVRMRSQDYERGLVKAAEPVSRTKQKVTRILIWTLLIGFIGTNLSNCGLQIKTQSTQAKLDQQVASTYNPAFKVRYQDIGAEVIKSWYAGTPAPVNLSNGVQWPSNAVPATVADNSLQSSAAASAATPGKGVLKVTNVAFMNGTQKTGDAQSFYQERLNYYALVNGVPQQISVTLGVADTAKLENYPILIAAPSILPYKAPGVSNITVKPAAPDAQLSDDAKKVIESWAQAYTENTATALKQQTGDTNADHAYTGLGSGWRYVAKSASPVWAVQRIDGSGFAVARITWTMKAPDVQVQQNNGSSGSTQLTVVGASQTQTMDVLLSGYKSGAPYVQAWGPVGTYLDLQPFQNAIDTKHPSDNQVNPEDNQKPAPDNNAPAPASSAPATAPAAP